MNFHKNFVLAVVFILTAFNQLNAQDLGSIGKEKPVKISGYLDARSIVYQASGIANRRSPFNWFLSGAPTLSIYGVSIPFTFTLSEQERSFRQPFNQFGLSPTYKWATVHLGYRNISFSPYTLAGHTLMGGGFEINPGKLKIGLMYGRLNRATTIDTVTGVVQPYSFTDRALAALIGYGTENHSFKISFLRAKSDSSSLYSKVKSGDSIPVTPVANFVVGVETVQKIADHLFFDAEGGYSVYTRNLASKIAVPSSLNATKDLFGFVLPVNASTETYLSYGAGLSYKQTYFTLRLAYKKTDPGFQSMGAYFFNNDLENITFSPSFFTKNNKLRFNGSIGWQKDNLKKQKEMTTKRVIGSANVSWNISSPLGIDFSFANFSSNSTPQVTLIENKYLMTNSTSSVSINPRYMFTKNQNTHLFLLSYNYSVLADANSSTKVFNEIKTQVVFFNYSMTIAPKLLSINGGVNLTGNTLPTGVSKYIGISAGVSKTMLKNRSLQLSFQPCYNFNTESTGANVLNVSANGNYQVARKHRLGFRWNLIRTSFKTTSIKGFTENTGELGYTFNF
jgi:hypothetical protein